MLAARGCRNKDPVSYTAIVKALIEAGANVNAVTVCNETALICAVQGYPMLRLIWNINPSNMEYILVQYGFQVNSCVELQEMFFNF